MQGGDAHHAGRLFRETFSDFYPQANSEELYEIGRSNWDFMAAKLQSHGLGLDDAWDTHQDFFVACLTHFRTHEPGDIRVLKHWTRVVARNVVHKHLKRRHPNGRFDHPIPASLDELVEQEFLHGASSIDELVAPEYLQRARAAMQVWLTEERAIVIATTAVSRLATRNREFATLFFLCERTEEDVMSTMKLPNRRSFNRLLRQTLALLTAMIRELVGHTIASTWIA